MKKSIQKTVVKKAINREDWLNKAKDLLVEFVFLPAGIKVHNKIRISIGFMSKGATKSNANKHTLGQCCPTQMSADNVNEIILNIDRDNELEMLATLTHEIIHAVDNNVNGHNHVFAGYMEKVGLEGIPTATVAGERLNGILKQIAKKLGKFPGKALTVPHIPADTRNIKVTCSCCEYEPLIIRASAQQILTFNNTCLRSGKNGALLVEFKPKHKNNAFKSKKDAVRVPLDFFTEAMRLVKEKQGKKGNNGYYRN